MIKSKSVTRQFFTFSFLLLLLVTVVVISSLFSLSNRILDDEYRHTNLVAKGISDDMLLSALTNNNDLILEEIRSKIRIYRDIVSIEFIDGSSKVRFYEINSEFKHNSKYINNHTFSMGADAVNIRTYSYISSRLTILKGVYFGLPALSVFFLLLLYRSLSKNLTAPINRLANGFKYYESQEFRNAPKKIDIPLYNNELDALISALDVTYEANVYKLQYEEILKEKIDEANRSKNAFIASMAHDFKTPLISLAGLNDEILRLKDSRISLLSKAMNAVISDMENMVFNVLDFSKMDAGEELQENIEKTDIFQLVRSIERSVEYAYLLRQNTITFHVNEKCNLLWLDSKKYRQVLRNLVSNAIKYTENGQIHISVKRLTDNKIITYVTDDGVGVSDDVIDSMFVPFKRQKDDLTEGSGIGLSFSKTLLSQLSCNIGFSNNNEGGASFWFDFPCLPSQDFDKRSSSLDKGFVLSRNQRNGEYVEGILRSMLGLEVVRGISDDLSQVSVAFVEGIFQSRAGSVFLDKAFLEEEVLRYKLVKKLIEMKIPVHAIIPSSLDSVKNRHKIINIYGFTSAVRINEIMDLFDQPVASNEGVLINESFNVPESLALTPILLAEDNDIYAQLVIMRLNRAGFENIDVARNGLEAVKLFEKKKYPIVLMDHMMPVLDGLKASKAIKARSSDVYIIGFTAVKSELDSQGQNEFMDIVLSKDLINFSSVVTLILNEISGESQIVKKHTKELYDKF